MTAAPPGEVAASALGRWAQVGRGRVWTASPELPAPDVWTVTVARLRTAGSSLHRSKHADTYRWARPGGDVYVKIYRRYRQWTAIKDWFRPSKAENVRRVSASLAAAGFVVPRVLAVGVEPRRLGEVASWCATAALDGEPVGERLAALTGILDPTTLRAKRGLLAAVGREVARLHATGVVAGDLVPANVWIAVAAAEIHIAFLDHDRTRIGRAPTPWFRARRNLVQLNRVVLAGVSVTDRLRVYRAYVAALGWPRAEGRRRLTWVVAKTVARRRAERGGADGRSFRTLMRAAGLANPRREEERR